MNSSDNMFSNLTSSPLSAQSWIVDNISSLISSNHDDDFTSDANLSNDCTLTARDDDKLNTPRSVPFKTNSFLDEVEVSRAFEHSPDEYMNPINRNNGTIITSKPNYSPPEQFLQQQDFLNSYNQLLQQQQQNLSFLYNNNNSFFDNQLQQPQLMQQTEQKRNMRHCLSSSDTSKYMDHLTNQSLRIPVSSSSFSLNNNFYDELNSNQPETRDDLDYSSLLLNQDHLRPVKQPYLQPSVSTSAINNYCLNNNNNNFGTLYEDSSVKKKKLTNYSMSASSIHQFPSMNPAYNQTASFAYSTSQSTFSSNSSLNENYSPSSSMNNLATNNNNKPASLHNKCLIKSLSGTHILSNNNGMNSSSISTPSSLNNIFNNKTNEYGLYTAENGFMSQTDQMHKDNKGYNNSNYYRELSNGLDVSNSYPEETNNLKSSQSNYSFNNTGLKTRIIKSSTTCFNKENVNNSQYQSNPAYFTHSTSYDNVKALTNKPIITKDKDTSHKNNNQQQQYTTPTNLNKSASASDQIVLHVRNLDYKISADEWKRILLENFRKHCKEIISVNVVTNADKSLLGVVKLATKEEARLAISCLHHKKIGYKRLNVNIAFSVSNNSPKSRVIALLKTNESSEMALTKFIELYELRYNQTITVSELFKLRDIVYIGQTKDGQGRHIKLTGRNYQNNLENEMQDLLQTPYCSLHSQRQDFNGSKDSANNVIGWLPNVIVSLRTFKSAVHKLLNDHGGQMPLLSFMDCYKCCIFNDNNSTQNNNSSNNYRSNSYSKDLSYQLIIDNESGVSLEHLITCAQDVQIQLNESFFKQLQWENDKSKPHNLQSRTTNKQRSTSMSSLELNNFNDPFDLNGENLDETMEESQKKLNQFGHEVVELFKGVPKCIIPLSKFNNEYHKKFGRQCRVADYGFTKLYELLESIPHILQILDSEYEKKLTLTHRIQVRRFSNDLIKVLKSHSSKQMFADDYPQTFERHYGRQFDIKDYGVCYLEDMLAELPESIICRKEIEGRTFMQIPKVIQMDEDRLCTSKLALDIVDMLRHKPRFLIQFNKFIPNFHHHFGRQCKLSNYGFSRLVELFEAIPETVQVLVKDSLQFVQLKPNLMLDFICLNLVKYLEENNFKIKISLSKLEEIYNSKYELIFYQDFGCENFVQLFSRLPFTNNYISIKPASSTGQDIELIDWIIEVEILNEKASKRVARLMLKKLMDESEELVLNLIKDKEIRFQSIRFVRFSDLFELLALNNSELPLQCRTFNNRSVNYICKSLMDYFVYNNNGSVVEELQIIGLSDIYWFAKQIRNIFKSSNLIDMTMPELETFYKKMYLAKNSLTKSVSVNEQLLSQQQQPAQPISVLPYKRLGYIDTQLLLNQGINMLVTVKKFTDKRICIHREFWPKSFIETKTPTFSESLNCNSSSSPMESDSSSSSTNSDNKSLTPLSHRLSGSSDNNNNSRRNILTSSLFNETSSSANNQYNTQYLNEFCSEY